MSHPPKVLVAMSGGVDSSVAACLLKEQGYDVVGVFMRLSAEGIVAGTAASNAAFATPAASAAACRAVARAGASFSLPIGTNSEPDQDPAGSGDGRHSGCCSAADASDARAVADRLGISFYALNFEQDFSRLIDYFADEYAAARTPNPCILCNTRLKFGKLVAYADAIDADLIATGHYARIDRAGGRPRLLRARYLAKDQSYVLFGVTPDVLRRTLFPLGEMTKDEVRHHARRFGLALHDKPESQDICFVPDGDYARIVRARRAEAFKPGRIRHVDGRDLGEHRGLPNFTIGQRRGLGIAMGTPVYVTDLDSRTATVTIGPKEALLSREAFATNVVWHDPPPGRQVRAEAKIRYNHEPAPAAVEMLPDDCAAVCFDEPQPAVTPGQAIVFYRGDEVLGGGWIARR